VPQVIFSYQSRNVAFLLKLLEWLNRHGIAIVDGTQTPFVMQEERPGESDLLEGCLNELSGWLWDGYEECSQEQNCGALIEQAQPMAMVMRFAELAKGPSVVQLQLKAMDCARALLLAGPNYGPGLLGIRDIAVEAGLSTRRPPQ
jgi:hypothetical protein